MPKYEFKPVSLSPFINTSGGLELVLTQWGVPYLKMHDDTIGKAKYFGPMSPRDVVAFTKLLQLPEIST